MRALFAEVSRKWIILITDPLNAVVFMIAFLNAIAPTLPKTVWQGLAVATSAGLCAVKFLRTPAQGQQQAAQIPGAIAGGEATAPTVR